MFGGSAPSQTANNWECPTCMVSNKADVKVCPCCQTLNPADGSAPTNGPTTLLSNGFKPMSFTKPVTTGKLYVYI